MIKLNRFVALILGVSFLFLNAFVVLAAEDDKKVPSDVTGVKIESVTANTVNLSWKAATDDTAVIGYKVYYGVKPVKMEDDSYSNEKTFTNVLKGEITGLDSNITYYFAMTALDAAKNESDFYSDEISGKTEELISEGGTGVSQYKIADFTEPATYSIKTYLKVTNLTKGKDVKDAVNESGDVLRVSMSLGNGTLKELKGFRFAVDASSLKDYLDFDLGPGGSFNLKGEAVFYPIIDIEERKTVETVFGIRIKEGQGVKSGVIKFADKEVELNLSLGKVAKTMVETSTKPKPMESTSTVVEPEKEEVKSTEKVGETLSKETEEQDSSNLGKEEVKDEKNLPKTGAGLLIPLVLALGLGVSVWKKR